MAIYPIKQFKFFMAENHCSIWIVSIIGLESRISSLPERGAILLVYLHVGSIQRHPLCSPSSEKWHVFSALCHGCTTNAPTTVCLSSGFLSCSAAGGSCRNWRASTSRELHSGCFTARHHTGPLQTVQSPNCFGQWPHCLEPQSRWRCRRPRANRLHTWRSSLDISNRWLGSGRRCWSGIYDSPSWR